MTKIMNIIKPKKLTKGCTISIIAPSGPVDKNKIETAKSFFEQNGYGVKLGENIFKSDNYLAGFDEQRLDDLHNAFLDDEVDAIVCARGGYGALRLIDKIDYKIIKNNPKIFCGYSDITILNSMFLKKAGLMCFHGAMAQSDFGNDEINEYTKNSFLDVLSGVNNDVIPADSAAYGQTGKEIKGILFGGNLSTMSSLCGVDFVPDEEFVFFAEDLNEPVYKIDRYFTQLFNQKNFKNNIKAMLIGDFMNCEDKTEFSRLLEEISKNHHLPVITGFPFSHGVKKATVPTGFRVIIQNGVLKFSGSDN